MYYNLESFGKEIRSIRNNLNLTQKNLSSLTDIHVDTLRKIENGKVTPSQSTLEILSPILKTDLNQLLLKYRLNNYYKLEEITNRLETKFDQDDYDTLQIEFNDLKTLISTEYNTYFINLMNQLLLLIESVILNKKYNKTNQSLNKLLKAIKRTTPHFSLNNYQNFVYNSMELRILMNIALLINKINSPEESLNIMRFCIKVVEPNDIIYPKLCYNLSYTYHRLSIHKHAFKYAELGIKHCNKNRNFNGLNLLYFRKGIAEYHLGYEKYMDSLKKSIYLCDILKQNELKLLLLENCKRIYNINFNL